MRARDYLSQAYRLDQRIYNMLEELERMKAMAACVTSQIGGEKVQTSHNNSKLEDSVLKIIRQKNDIDAEIGRLVDLKAEIRDVIFSVSKPEQRFLLEERYLYFRSWEEIAVDMSYSLRWIHILHDRALTEVERILKEREAV